MHVTIAGAGYHRCGEGIVPEWYPYLLELCNPMLTCEGKMLDGITAKNRLGAIALLPLLLFVFPRIAAAQGDGQKIFDSTCAKCHGADGTGNTPVGKAVGAKDLGSAEAKKMTDADIHTQIEQGKGNMPPFGGSLNKAQIDSLIPIVRAFGKKAGAAKKPS